MPQDLITVNPMSTDEGFVDPQHLTQVHQVKIQAVRAAEVDNAGLGCDAAEQTPHGIVGDVGSPGRQLMPLVPAASDRVSDHLPLTGPASDRPLHLAALGTITD